MANRDQPSLTGRRILVVEDEYFIAQEIRDLLTESGAEIVGPVARLSQGLEMAQNESRIDCAVLDFNLHGEHSVDIARSLSERGVPFVLLTGYDVDGISNEFDRAPKLVKPLDREMLLQAVKGEIESVSS